MLGHLIYGLSVWAFTAVLTVRCFWAAFAGILVGVLVGLAVPSILIVMIVLMS